jgi:endonuclease G
MPRYSWTRSWQARSSVSVVLATVSSTLLIGSPRASSAEEKKAPQSVSASVIPVPVVDHHHHHLSHTGIAPVSPIRIFRPNSYLEIAYDTRTRNPVYVLEQLQPQLWGGRNNKTNDNTSTSRNTSTSTSTRRPHFTEEKELPEMYRSRNSHYRNTEYDRGHMAPAADFVHDRLLLTDTFTLCNTAPQLANVNRKVWAALEDWTRRVARAAHENNNNNYNSGGGPAETRGTTSFTTLVLTGPLFLPARKVSDKVFQYEYAAIGQPPALQSVPTHFFKVVVVVHTNHSDRNNKSINSNNNNNNSTIQAFACFVIPNEESVADETDLTQFVVPWTALEAVTGLEMFPALTTSSISVSVSDTAAVSVHQSKTKTNNATQADWKASADAVTRATITEHQTSTPFKLLLTDGTNSAGGGGGAGGKRKPKHPTPLQHLCSQGQCQRPYRLLLSSFG